MPGAWTIHWYKECGTGDGTKWGRVCGIGSLWKFSVIASIFSRNKQNHPLRVRMKEVIRESMN